MKIHISGRKGYIGSYLYSHLKEVSVTSIDYSSGLTEKDYFNFDLTDIYMVNDYAKNCAHFDALIFLVGLAHKKGRYNK